MHRLILLHPRSMKMVRLRCTASQFCNYEKQSLHKKKELKESQRNKAETLMYVGTDVAKHSYYWIFQIHGAFNIGFSDASN